MSQLVIADLNFCNSDFLGESKMQGAATATAASVGQNILSIDYQVSPDGKTTAIAIAGTLPAGTPFSLPLDDYLSTGNITLTGGFSWSRAVSL